MTTPPPDDHGLDQTDTEALTSVLADLRDEVRGLRSDVQAERRGRRITQQLAGIVIVAALVLGAGWIADLRATVERRETERCTTRYESRAEIREMGVALVAYAVQVAGIDDDPVAAEVIAGAEKVAIDTLPPPDC